MSTTSETRHLRRFGFMVGGVFAALAVWPVVFQSGPLRGWAAAIAGVLIVLGAVMPIGLRWPYRGWMFAGHLLGWLNTRLLLGLVYYLVMTPIGLLLRLVGRDPLDRRLMDRASYWRKCEPRSDPRGSMERQF